MLLFWFVLLVAFGWLLVACMWLQRKTGPYPVVVVVEDDDTLEMWVRSLSAQGQPVFVFEAPLSEEMRAVAKRLPVCLLPGSDFLAALRSLREPFVLVATAKHGCTPVGIRKRVCTLGPGS